MNVNIIKKWGSTPGDRSKRFACDKLLNNPNGAYWRAVNINAPAELVYKWLSQMKVAPYSYDKLDNKGRLSPQHLTPGIENLKQNQKMMTIFNIESFIPNKEINLSMDVPPDKYAKYYVPTVLTYNIFKISDEKSRVVVKYVARYPRTAVGLVMRFMIPVMDYVLMRRQLLNFKKLAERDYNADYSTRAKLTLQV